MPGAPQQLGLDPDQVMAIGDNFNDVEMLEYAGLPVVMGNAVPGAAGTRLAHDRDIRTSAEWRRPSSATRLEMRVGD